MLSGWNLDQDVEPVLHLLARPVRWPGVETHAVDQGESGNAVRMKHRELLGHAAAEVMGDTLGALEAQ